jgi:hypothetical protein
VILALVSSVTAADFNYLSQTVNTINTAFYRPTGQVSDSTRKDLMKLACVTLTRFISDPSFEAVVMKAGEKDQAAEGEVKQAISDVGKLNSFVTVETEALRANGYAPLSVNDIISTTMSGRHLNGIARGDYPVKKCLLTFRTYFIRICGMDYDGADIAANALAEIVSR